MSTGAECRFTEVAPGRWQYWLQYHPYGETDDGETSPVFSSYRAAYKHLQDNHANPGGSSASCLPEGEHVHEWHAGGQVAVGFTVQIRVESLGPKADPIDVIRHIQSLPPEHPAFRTWPTYGWSDGVVKCQACGHLKGESGGG